MNSIQYNNYYEIYSIIHVTVINITHYECVSRDLELISNLKFGHNPMHVHTYTIMLHFHSIYCTHSYTYVAVSAVS